MGKQNRRNRCLLVGYVVLVIAAGLLSRSTLPLPNWFREYGGDTLWSMMMYGIFALQSEIAVDRYAAVFLSDRMLAAAGL